MILGPLDDIAMPGSKGYLLEDGREIFVVRHAGGTHAYLNRCPHTGSPLDWVPDQFLDLDKAHIQCATHDARFRLHDGFCVKGPCAGGALTPLALDIREGVLHLGD